MRLRVPGTRRRLTPTYSTPDADASAPERETLHARLAREMRGPDGLHGSLQQLADRHATPSQRSNVRRALRDIRRTHGCEYREEQRWDGRTQLSPIRRLVRPLPGGRSADLSLNPLDQTGGVDQTATSDHRARARESASLSTARSRVRPKRFPAAPAIMRGRPPGRAREGGGCSSHLDPSPELRATLAARFGGRALAELVAELQTPRCAAPHDDVDRALRTLAERGNADAPLRHFRFFLQRARAGDLLCDRAADAAATVAAEHAARSMYAWEPDGRSRPRSRPDALAARIAGLRSRLAHVSPKHPARDTWEAELAALSAELAARRTPSPPASPESHDDGDLDRLPTESELYAAEYGQPQWGHIVDIGMGVRAVVQPPRPAPPRDMRAELDRHLDTLDLSALDRADEC